MRSDQVSKTYKRYEKFYTYLKKPQKEHVEKDVKKTSVKLKDLFFPNGYAKPSV